MKLFKIIESMQNIIIEFQKKPGDAEPSGHTEAPLPIIAATAAAAPQEELIRASESKNGNYGFLFGENGRVITFGDFVEKIWPQLNVTKGDVIEIDPSELQLQPWMMGVLKKNLPGLFGCIKDPSCSVEDFFEMCRSGTVDDMLNAMYFLENSTVEHPSILLQESANKKTPLAVACLHGHAHMVALLLDRGANIHALIGGFFTALHYVINHSTSEISNIDVVRLLFDKGAVVDEVSVYSDLMYRGFTPLHLAVLRGNLSATQVLLEKGADISQVFFQGQIYGNIFCGPWIDKKQGELVLPQGNALHLVLQQIHVCSSLSGVYMEILSKLLQAEHANGALQGKDVDGRSPLHLSVIFGLTGASLLVIGRIPKDAAGMQIINAQDNLGNTALHYAVQNGDTYTVQALIVAGADITIKNNKGETPNGLNNDLLRELLAKQESLRKPLTGLNAKIKIDALIGKFSSMFSASAHPLDENALRQDLFNRRAILQIFAPIELQQQKLEAPQAPAAEAAASSQPKTHTIAFK